MSKPVEGFYEAAKYLGQFLPEKEPILSELALLGDKERLVIAFLHYLKEDKDTPQEDRAEIDDLIKLIKYIGFANWKRDIVTDMAIKIGKHEELDSFDDATTVQNPEKAASDTP